MDLVELSRDSEQGKKERESRDLKLGARITVIGISSFDIRVICSFDCEIDVVETDCSRVERK